MRIRLAIATAVVIVLASLSRSHAELPAACASEPCTFLPVVCLGQVTVTDTQDVERWASRCE